MKGKGVMEYLEELGKQKPPPLTTVLRTTTSKYLFHLVVRAYRDRLRVAPEFHAYSKQGAGGTKGLIEEFSLFQEGPRLVVLEGFANRWVQELDIPAGCHVLAETDDGDLKPEQFSPFREKRNILRLLKEQLTLPKLTLTDLLKVDWLDLTSFEDYEVELRWAKLMDWGLEELQKRYEVPDRGNPLLLLKRGRPAELLPWAEEMGSDRFYSMVTNLTADLVHYRSLRLMGHDEKKCERELELSWRRAKQLEEANNVLSAEDLRNLVRWLIDIDPLSRKKGFVTLLVAANPIRVR